jgi:hypothetical protein
MTEQFSFPLLHDPAPGELERRKRHLLSEIARKPAPRGLSLPDVPPLRLRYALFAVAAICAAAGAAVVFSGAPGGGVDPLGPGPRGGVPIDLSFVRDADGALVSVDMTIRAATLGGTAQLQVVRGEVDSSVAVPPDVVVFQEEVPMTNIASPLSGPPGTVMLSTWSGTLSTSDWSGGCQRGPYEIAVNVVNVSPESNPDGRTRGESILSGEFSCNTNDNGS